MKYLFFVFVVSSELFTVDHHLERVSELQYVNIDSALFHAGQALLIAEVEDKNDLARVCNVLGRLLVSKNLYDSGMYYHSLALTLSVDEGDMLETAESYNNMGIVSDEQSRHQSAIEYYYQALIIYEKLADLNGQAKVNNNIGIVYKDIGDLEQSVPFYKRAIDLYYELENTLGVASLQNNLATVYNDLGSYDSALIMSEYSIQYFEENGLTQYKPYPQINAGDALIGLAMPQEALNILYESKAGLEATGNLKELADVHRAISESYYSVANYDSSLHYALISLAMAQKVEVTTYVQNASERVYLAYEAKGMNDSTLEYFSLFVDTKENLREESRLRQIRSLEIEYETQKTAKELAEANLLLTSQKNQLLLLANAFVFTFAVGLFVYFRSKSNQKRKIAEAKIKEQRQSLRAVINAQEEERTRIARELHDGVGQSMSAVLINQKSIDYEGLPEEVQLKVIKVTDLVEITRQEIRTISHQMMPSSLIEVGLSDALKQMIERSFDQSNIKYEFDAILPEGKRYEADIEVGIYRICQELVQNIIKHAKAHHVSVNIYERNRNLQLIVEDDGVGFDYNKLHDGAGLLNIRTRIEMLGGNLKMETNIGAGTTATIKLLLS